MKLANGEPPEAYPTKEMKEEFDVDLSVRDCIRERLSFRDCQKLRQVFPDFYT